MTSKRPAPDPESLRDEHLLAALRHVPEDQENAPAELSARIRAAAHLAAAASAESSRAIPGIQATPSPAPRQTESTGFNAWLRRWFGSPYAFAGAGTAMAGLLVATVLWVGRDEWPHHAQNHPSTPAAQAEIKQAADAPSAASAPPYVRDWSARVRLSGSPDTDSPPDASVGKVTSADKTQARPLDGTNRLRQERQPTTAGHQESAASAAPSLQLRRADPKPVPESTASTLALSSPAAAMPPAAALAAAPSAMTAAPPSPADSSAAAPPPTPLAAKATAPRLASAARREEATPEEKANAAALAARSAGTLAFSMAAPEAPTRAPSTGAWLRLAATRATHWQLGEGTPQAWQQSPHSEWLHSMAIATAQADREAPGEAPAGVLDKVQISRDSRAIGRLWLTESLLRWCDEQGNCREAEVDPARMRELLSTLPR